MADEMSMALAELLGKINMNTDFLREGVRVLAQALMELEVTQQLGAGRHERTEERTGQRNGYRDRQWDTRVGTIDLRVPRVRDGGYIPSLLEPRRRSERALRAVVQEAYVQGVSTPGTPRSGEGCAGASAGEGGDQQESGQPGVPGPGPRGRGVPRAPA